MSPIGKLVLVSSAASVLVVLAILLAALGSTEAGIALAAVAVTGFVIAFFLLAATAPHYSLRTAREYARLGYASLAVVGAELLLVAAHLAVQRSVAAAALIAVLATGQAVLAAGFINAARMLRRVPALLAPGEEPRAIALGDNAMPLRACTLVVATDERIVWDEGDELRLEDVERFDTDRRAGALTVEGRDTTLSVKPVTRPELEKFERLLAAPTRPGR